MTKRDIIKYKIYQYVLAQCACLVACQLRTDKNPGDKEMCFELDEFFHDCFCLIVKRNSCEK